MFRAPEKEIVQVVMDDEDVQDMIKCIQYAAKKAGILLSTEQIAFVIVAQSAYLSSDDEEGGVVN